MKASDTRRTSVREIACGAARWIRRRARRLPVTLGEAAVLALAIVLLLGFVNVPQVGERPLPDLRPLDPQARKEQFFDILLPAVAAVNGVVADRRERLEELSEKIATGRGLSWLDRRWLRRMAERYRVETEDREPAELVSLLETRIDVVPASLVLAQAAKESGWGTSRFAREGNNLFGMRCFDPGCGIVPRARADGRSFEVSTFESIRDSVEEYVLNINRHVSYERFRDLRAALREAGRPLNGIALAEGLQDYSERGRAYVEDIRSLISQNGLQGTTGARR